MKQSRFTEEQIVEILKECERGETTVEEVCRKHWDPQANLLRMEEALQGTEAGMSCKDLNNWSKKTD